MAINLATYAALVRGGVNNNLAARMAGDSSITDAEKVAGLTYGGMAAKMAVPLVAGTLSAGEQVAAFEDMGCSGSDAVLLAAAGLGVPDYSATVLADAPLGYWKLAEPSGTTTTDSSGNAHDGAYTAGVTLGGAGLITGETDKTADFLAGNPSRADVPYAAWMDVAAFTITAVIQGDDLANGGFILNRDTLGGSSNSGGGGRIFQFIAGTHLNATVFDSGGTPHALAGLATLVNGTVYHVGVSYEPVTAVLKLYVNGALDTSVDLGSNVVLQTGNQIMCIGAQLFQSSQLSPFNGRIEKVAFFSGELALSRILAQAQAAKVV